uniref:glucuronosyltransferase n=2 Tax=Meloidogyne TaxID=189290 RepID=A0A6V7Y7P7_MELEN|nr:unnamed protein product [Meloidogyne enterolobii]
MGTVVPWYQENIPGIHEMLKIMAKQTHCHFTIRIHESLLPEYISENIHIVAQPRKVKQQELLARKNMKLFISHCGANSLLEAMYAGVPLICLPAAGDQPYNSAIVENLEIGVWVQRENMVTEIGGAIDLVLKDEYVL